MGFEKMKIMTAKPLNAETPVDRLRTWTTDNAVFFKRNQGQFSNSPVTLPNWVLSVEGLVTRTLTVSFADIQGLPKAEVANTLECSGNGRSLLREKASGNPWTVGGVGNAIWGGVWLKELLLMAGPMDRARHVSFEGFDQPMGSAGVKFVRSIPIAKAMNSTLLAYEMNGEPLPVEHGYPLRALALGWTGANCVKWLQKITVMERPREGFFMDKVYRIFQKGEDPAKGTVVQGIGVKAIIVEPLSGEMLSVGRIPIRGAAYAGEAGIQTVEVSADDGLTWNRARLLGPQHDFAWRHWEYVWNAARPGNYTLLARATDTNGNRQPETARWNVLGYGNNGIREHAVQVSISEPE